MAVEMWFVFVLFFVRSIEGGNQPAFVRIDRRSEALIVFN